MIAVVSSVYGDYDKVVAPVPQSIPCEFVLVTDREIKCDPWRVVVEPRPGLDSRMAAKVAKCRPDLYTRADITVWMDASMWINSPEFAAWASAFVEQGEIAQFKHPERQRLTDEAEVSTGLVKYHGLPVREQVQHYLDGGYPDDWGLWATGLIVRRWDLPTSFGDEWLREQLRWTYQDQLSQPPLLRRYGRRPVPLDGMIVGHHRFHLRPHRDGT